VSEVERRRRELRKRFLQAIYDLAAGSPNQFVYWPNVASRLGWDDENRDHLEEALGYADYLAGLGLISIEVDEGTIYRITAAGIDEVEQEGAPSAPVLPPSIQEEMDDVARVEDAPCSFGKASNGSGRIIQTQRPWPSS
jgi:hypothetical protein